MFTIEQRGGGIDGRAREAGQAACLCYVEHSRQGLQQHRHRRRYIQRDAGRIRVGQATIERRQRVAVVRRVERRLAFMRVVVAGHVRRASRGLRHHNTRRGGGQQPQAGERGQQAARDMFPAFPAETYHVFNYSPDLATSVDVHQMTVIPSKGSSHGKLAGVQA